MTATEIQEEGLPDDLVQLIHEFEKTANAVCGDDEKDDIAKPMPKFLYHYTNDRGLKGILETGKLWLSDIFSLNDPSEIKHGTSLALDIFKQKVTNHQLLDPSKPLGELCQTLESVLNSNVSSTGNYFVCSTSAKRDDLNQWRAYGDNGRGFAIGFDANKLKMELNSWQTSSALFKIHYNEKKLEKMQRNLIYLAVKTIDLAYKKHPELILKFSFRLSKTLAGNIIINALQFKHKAYENEAEYRLLHIVGFGTDPIWKARDYRPDEPDRPYEQIRYTEMNWGEIDPSALHEIIIGPAADQEKSQRLIRGYLGQFKNVFNDKTLINHSDIPYKPLSY